MFDQSRDLKCEIRFLKEYNEKLEKHNKELRERIKLLESGTRCDGKTNQENWNENKNRALFLIERSNAKSSRWIPVKERLPPMGEVLISHCGHVCIAWHRGQGEFETGSRMMLVVGKHDITHWMPLPEPPKESP